ncbi:MAG TPA: hypothetical protein VFM85_00475 [Actinomycetota bacterium]|nr:hypothetical protein [Actinomycetota bacterium]
MPFADLVGFTGRSDRADPEVVHATLRPYQESDTPTIPPGLRENLGRQSAGRLRHP